MKISLNWLNDYLKIDMDPAALEEVLTAIGLEVEGMEYTKSGPELDGVVVGEVTSCEQHPNADRLRLTQVQIAADQSIQVVCGAPNVAQGQKVLVATVGTVLPTDDDSVFKIKKGKIRGELSEGMICAEDELGIGNSHDGIMVLDASAPIGQSAEEYLKFETDVIYDIGLTPNRSDATSHRGVAKDIAAYFQFHKLNGQHELNLADTSALKFDGTASFDVEVKDYEACPRYAGVLLKGITVEPAPEWIQNRLRSIGVRPINNIVDITNFILHEFGQPLHAFDADKIQDQRIIVQHLPQDTAFITLDEKEIKLDKADLMICDGKNNPMCIAGVYGGLHSGVTDATTSIFLESAHFEASSLRRTSFRHLLRTDAAMVFEKGSDPSVPVDALQRAVQLLQEYAGATIASELIDIYPNPIQKKQITVSYDKIVGLIGGSIDKDDIRSCLDALKMDILADDGVQITVAVPTDKADVTRDVDLVEEVLRIYGFNKVELPGYIQSAIQTSQGVNTFKLKNDLANMLTGAGFTEMMGLSLVDQKYIEANDALVTINNTSNTTLNIMRPSMVYSALETVAYNQNRQQNSLKVFENGRSYQKNGADFIEQDHLSMTIVGNYQPESWNVGKLRKVNFYDLKSYVHMVLGKLGLLSSQIQQIEEDPYFEQGLIYHRGPKEIVRFGAINEDLQERYGVRNTVYHAIFNWDVIAQFIKKSSVSVKDITRFPVMRRDLSLVVDKAVSFHNIVGIATKVDKKMLQDIQLFDVYVDAEKLGADKKSYAVSFIFEHLERTLKDKEVNKIMDQLIKTYENKLEAVIRK